MYLQFDSSGEAYSSRDGLAWADAGAAPGLFEAGMLYRGQMYVLTRDAPASVQRLRSGHWDGVCESTYPGFDMATNGQRLVAVFDEGGSVASVQTSLDGQAWSAVPGMTHTGWIRWIHDRFFLRSQLDGRLFVSMDGLTWSLAAISLSTLSVRWPVAWNGSRFIAAAVAGTMSSADGITWTRNADTGLPVGPTVFMFARGASLITGSKPTDPGNVTLYDSHDGGAHWTSTGIITSGNLSTPNGFANEMVMAMPGGWFVWNGMNPISPYSAQAFWSPDGRTWTQLAAPTQRSLGVAYPGGRYAFVQDQYSHTLYRFDGAKFEAGSGSTAWTMDGLLLLNAVPSTIRVGTGGGSARFHTGGRHGL